jgi:hypothetical protein
MEITKTITTDIETMDFLFDTRGTYSLRYYEPIDDKMGGKRKFRATFRGDENIIEQIKKTVSGRKLIEIKKDDDFIESVKELIEEEQKKIKKFESYIK